MRAEYWRDLVRRWVLVEEGIGSPEFLKLERAGLLREAIAALQGESGDSIPAAPSARGQVSSPFEIAADVERPNLNKSGGSEGHDPSEHPGLGRCLACKPVNKSGGSDVCGQCGQPYSARACGPTHAIRKAERGEG